MPMMDGLALTRHVKEHAQLKTMPVLLFSSLITDDTRHKGDQVGADKQLAKPQLLVGATRSQEITVNIVIPIGLIFARASKSEKLETGFNVLFQSGKKPGDNKLLRFMKHYIFGNKKDMLKVLVNDKQAQGLMQVYQDFCTQNDNNCQRCQFPDIVKKYFS